MPFQQPQRDRFFSVLLLCSAHAHFAISMRSGSKKMAKWQSVYMHAAQQKQQWAIMNAAYALLSLLSPRKHIVVIYTHTQSCVFLS